MPRQKKEAERIGLNLDKSLMQEVRALADERGQTITTAVERLLTAALKAEKQKESGKTE